MFNKKYIKLSTFFNIISILIIKKLLKIIRKTE